MKLFEIFKWTRAIKLLIESGMAVRQLYEMSNFYTVTVWRLILWNFYKTPPNFSFHIQSQNLHFYVFSAFFPKVAKNTLQLIYGNRVPALHLLNIPVYFLHFPIQPNNWKRSELDKLLEFFDFSIIIIAESN